eukprot:UN23675
MSIRDTVKRERKSVRKRHQRLIFITKLKHVQEKTGLLCSLNYYPICIGNLFATYITQYPTESFITAIWPSKLEGFYTSSWLIITDYAILITHPKKTQDNSDNEEAPNLENEQNYNFNNENFLEEPDRLLIKG